MVLVVIGLLRMIPMKTRLLAPLYISSLVLVLLVVGQGGLSVLIGFLRQQAASWVTHTLLVEREGERLLSAALNESTGLRGYLLTRNRASLEPYWQGQVAFHSSLDHLYRLVQGNPAQLKRLNEIKAVHERWHRQFAQKALSGSANNSTLAGKTLFDPLRSLVRTLLQHEEIIRDERNHQLHQLYQLNTVLNLFSTLVILAGVGLNLWLLHQRIEVPLHQLTEASQAWRTGQMEVRLDYAAPDEIGRLAEVLDAMASEIRCRQERNEVRNQQLEEPDLRLVPRPAYPPACHPHYASLYAGRSFWTREQRLERRARRVLPSQRRSPQAG